MTVKQTSMPVVGRNGTSEQGPVYGMAIQQLTAAAEKMDLRPGTLEILSAPKRSLTVNFPVTMDDGQVRVFTGHRVQHNMARGPGQRGHTVSPRRHLGRGEGPGDVDDLEVCGNQPSLRRRQGRGHLRSEADVRAGAGRAHPKVCHRDLDADRPGH